MLAATGRAAVAERDGPVPRDAGQVVERPFFARGPRNREVFEHDRPAQTPVALEKRSPRDRTDVLNLREFQPTVPVGQHVEHTSRALAWSLPIGRCWRLYSASL